MQERKAAGAHSLRCPFCEVHELELSGQDSARCPSCGAFLSGVLLETLLQITALPLAVGRHAWMCGTPRAGTYLLRGSFDQPGTSSFFEVASGRSHKET